MAEVVAVVAAVMVIKAVGKDVVKTAAYKVRPLLETVENDAERRQGQ